MGEGPSPVRRALVKGYRGIRGAAVEVIVSALARALARSRAALYGALGIAGAALWHRLTLNRVGQVRGGANVLNLTVWQSALP
jgi:hypothetical protein